MPISRFYFGLVSTDVLVYDTGFRAIEATGKMLTRWGELKAEHPPPPKKTDNR